MSTFRHPAFPTILHRCDDALDDDALAKGWLPVERVAIFAWRLEEPVKVEYVDSAPPQEDE